MITASTVTRVTLSLLLCAAAVPASDWSSFRGPAGTGQVAAGLPEGEGPLSLRLAWKRPLGSGYSGLSISGDLVVTAMSGGERDYLLALDKNSGEERWRYDLAPAYAGHDGSHDGPIATPAISEGRVFMLSAGGRLAAVDLENGAELWAFDIPSQLEEEGPLYGFASSPAVAEGVVALHTGGDEGLLTGFDAATGEVLWRAFEGVGLAMSSAVIVELGGQKQVVVQGEAWLAAVAPKTGESLWKVDFEEEAGGMGSFTQSPVYLGDGRFLAKHAQEATLVVEVAAGDSGFEARQTSESRGLTRSYSPPTVAGERAFGYTSRFLSAVEPATGELLWRSREPGDGFLIALDDHLVVLTKTGALHLGAATAEGWNTAADLEVFEELAWTPPSYADGSVYVRSLGEVARVDLVREDAPTAVAATQRLPGVLKSLLAEAAEAADGAAGVEAALASTQLPLIDGEEVVFVWHGEAADVAVAGDMIGMRREEVMARVEGTNLWWWSTRLDPKARISYVFIVDDELKTDPTHERSLATSVLGPDMNWWRGESFEASWFAMPEWPGRVSDKEAAGVAGRLETIEISLQPPTPEDGEEPEAVAMTSQVWLPPGYDASEVVYPVVYVHHAAAFSLGGWPATLDRVVGESVRPLIVVFVELPRMRGAGGLFVEQVVPAIDERFRTLATREGRANVGMGWPGFSATTLTFRNGEVFGALGVQSLFLLEQQMAAVEAAIGDADAEALPMRIYLEWGAWDLVSPHEEMNMRESSRWGWEQLRSRGWEPIGGEIWDSTDFASWRNRTDLLLQALFPLGDQAQGLAAWQTGR